MSHAKRHLRTALITLALLGAAITAAVTPNAGVAQAAQTEEPAKTTEAAAAADKPSEDKNTDQPSSEVFIPSEDISEDFAVSFPVDI
jgi:hypothetical protein